MKIIFEIFNIDESNDSFTETEARILFALLKLATTKGSIVTQWVNGNLSSQNSSENVELFELLEKEIRKQTNVMKRGVNPTVDEWLGVIDSEIDYSSAKKITKITNTLEKLRNLALPIKHYINYGSLTYTDEDGNRSYVDTSFSTVNSALPNDNIDPLEYKNFITEEQYLSGIDKIIDLYMTDIKLKVERDVV